MDFYQSYVVNTTFPLAYDCSITPIVLLYCLWYSRPNYLCVSEVFNQILYVPVLPTTLLKDELVVGVLPWGNLQTSLCLSVLDGFSL